MEERNCKKRKGRAAKRKVKKRLNERKNKRN